MSASVGAKCVCTSNPQNTTGAVVVELLAFNWDWRGTSDLYFNTTASMGDIHHFGWRATSSRWVVYTQGPGDEKYADWNIEECTAR